MGTGPISIDEYLKQCQKLSLTARSAISLLIFEKFCTDNKLCIDDVTDLLNYLWQWPLIKDSGQFDVWESERPTLVNSGLGDEFPEQLTELLSSNGIKEYQFRVLVSGVTEILWSSFWGAADNEGSLKYLKSVISVSGLEELPALTPFKFSVFTDSEGWGCEIMVSDRDFWRQKVGFTQDNK